ncbi:MAG: hypothetical protein ACI89W_000796 [Gammaproteobacteria bacterium]|jgi:hypothetical protein
MDLVKLQIDLAKRSKWNIGYFLSGLVFWFFVLIIYFNISKNEAPTFWLVGTFFIFPVAIIFSKLCKADPFTKGNKLADLVGHTHMSVVSMSFPIILIVYFNYPDALLLTMSIAYCIDFYVMSWAFGSRMFGIAAGVRVFLSSAVWLFLPEYRDMLIPTIVLLSYSFLVVLIPVKRSIWLKSTNAIQEIQ